MNANPRSAIGQLMTGEILEIGPGSRPFTVMEGATVRYADRSVEGGRDANWPELIGTEPGVQADFDIDLDVDGLAPIPSLSLDGLIASHVIEHVANPIAVVREFSRVLRPGGRLLLVVPDRSRTFDRVRAPTPFEHVLAEFRTGVTSVSDEHIREFCGAIYGQAPIHPPLVRAWHDPAGLAEPAMLALHRRRSIHVHCWSPEEFASFVVGSIAEGFGLWRLIDLYFAEDFPDGESDEFALLLEADSSMAPEATCRQFVSDWTDRVIARERSDAQRIVRFHCAIQRDLATAGADISMIPLTSLASRFSVLKAAACGTRVTELQARLKESECSIAMASAAAVRESEKATAFETLANCNAARVLALESSRSWRLTAPLRTLSRYLLRH